MRKKGYVKFDSTRKYRYLLRRKWDENLPQVTFVMLNPSKANEYEDDHTLTRCISFTKSWEKYGSLEVVNLFAHCATDPGELFQVDNPVGIKNDCYIQVATKRADLIILAWGASEYLKKNRGREEKVLSLISGQQPLHCLKITKEGYPNHPVRLPKNLKPIIFPNSSL
ncbi:DUF1643 domain-containing protein [Nostoc sp.]|uniref:DUF1643 domain-containing protein n=1 Tax=Nostoc sp. TaxID=1180 RepID=UPI002FFCB1DB